MLTASATFAVFVMLGLSSLAIFWAKRVGLPHTVFLVIVGLILGGLSQLPLFHFFAEFRLTPELLFFLLLPTLIFESAYNINVRRMVEDGVVILILSVIGLLVSTIVIGGALYYALMWLGLAVPFMVTLIFGALISATDPVAVLALFKEYGAPRRLSLIFEGESLFNDATAVALFMVLLEVARFGYHGFDTIVAGTITFTSMMVGGILFGVIVGSIFAKLIGLTRENEIASITLTIVLAHITFIGAELASHHLHIGDTHLPLSPIIATTISALLMGNYGRSKIHPRAEEFVEKLWGQLAFIANSLIFILIGLLVTTMPALTRTSLLMILVTIIIVAVARAISIYPVVTLFNRFASTISQVPMAWQHLLAWGSLRGALAVTMVLLIPDDLSFAGWQIAMTPKEFLLSLTVGCIVATLFIKAPTIQTLMRRLKLDTLTSIEEVESLEARALIHHEVTERIKRHIERGYIEATVGESILRHHELAFSDACEKLTSPNTKALAERVLRMFAIGIERRHLKELYHHNEVNEAVFRHLGGKLQLQLETIEAGNLKPDMSLHTDGKDIFDHITNGVKQLINPSTKEEDVDHLFMYYRAQAIISRKVIKELTEIDTMHATHIFTKEALEHVISLYTTFKEQSEAKMHDIAIGHKVRYEKLASTLANRGVAKIEESMLAELFERQLITPKLYLTLKEELLAKH